eukprot:3078584-Amphidinium_carterae.1
MPLGGLRLPLPLEQTMRSSQTSRSALTLKNKHFSSRWKSCSSNLQICSNHRGYIVQQRTKKLAARSGTPTIKANARLSTISH